MKLPSHILAPLALSLAVLLSACSGTPAQTPQSTAGTSTAPNATAQTSAAQPGTNATPTGEAPKYGGTINLMRPFDVASFDDAGQGAGPWSMPLVAQELWGGDWTKGSAGGYGTGDSAWDSINPDVFALKTGFLAESWQVNIDKDQQQATVIYKIRPGVHFALDPNNEMSKAIGGRELTVDDVLNSMKLATTDSKQYVYRSNPELRNIDISKTGPMEVTVKMPLAALVSGMSRLGDTLRIYANEVRTKDNTDWKNLVGTGPFILTNYVAGSSFTYVKNPSYWMKDPIGPGKGNKLPYVDGVQEYIIPDTSTRLTALRTGKIDQIDSINWEDSDKIKKDIPQMKFGLAGYGDAFPINMRTDKAPYSDIRVRRALMMATDFNGIKQSINGDLGVINTYPYDYYKEYKDLYVGAEDSDLPPSVKELFSYNPEKAKQLLAEAGFPNGFKTSIITTQTNSSYFEAIASMWAKAGITLNIDIKDSPAITNIANSQSYNDLIVANGKGPLGLYYMGTTFNGTPSFAINMSFVKDPYVEETLGKMRILAATDEKESMKLGRQLGIYALDHAWAIPRPSYQMTTFWWPWVKNYSGEMSVGAGNGNNWSQWIWVDQDLKKSMGH